MEEQTQKSPGRTARPDRKGWLNEYETIFVLPNDQTDEAAEKTAERMRAAVAREGGRVVKFTFWGRKKTAFDVARASRALYVHMDYLGGGKTVDEVERSLRNSEEVVRFQSALIKKLVDPETRPTEADEKLAGDLDERAPRPAAPEGASDLEAIPEELADEAASEPTAE
ncbi:MAG: 30S ribosomal protein S6 [Myxococcales bacterium]